MDYSKQLESIALTIIALAPAESTDAHSKKYQNDDWRNWRRHLIIFRYRVNTLEALKQITVHM